MGEWIESNLTDIAEYINGYAFKPSDFSESGVPIVRIEQLKNPQSKFDFFKGKIPEKNWIDNGDLIFSWSASLFLKIWHYDFAYLNQHLFKVVPFELIEKSFLKYLIEYAIEDLKKMSHGSTMQHITRKELRRFKVTYPTSKKEQATTAKVLSTIDLAINQTEKLIAKYERIKTGLMQDLLTKGIDEYGNVRSEETHEFKASLVGRIPVEWDVVKLRHCGTFSKGSTISKSNLSFDGVPCILYGELYTRYKNTIYETYSKVPYDIVNGRSSLQYGDILFTGSGETHEEIGICSTYLGQSKCYAGGDIIILTLKDNFNPLTMNLLLNSFRIQKQKSRLSQGSSVIHIYPKNLSKIEVPLITEREQKLIAANYIEIQKVIDKSYKSLLKLRSQKTGLMQDLLTNNVSVEHLMQKVSAIV